MTRASRYGSMPPDREDGSATVWFAGVASGLVILGVLLLTIVSIMSGKAHAQAVADMAALAGADLSSVAVFEAADSGLACAQVQEVAQRNAVKVKECRVDGGDTLVVVQRDVSLGWLSVVVHARARAGPPSSW